MSDEDNRSKQDSHLRKCDIVMKGGITSGVVYPGAVSEIAKDFNLRGIGGTSAGAIAAAAAPASDKENFLCARRRPGGKKHIVRSNRCIANHGGAFSGHCHTRDGARMH